MVHGEVIPPRSGSIGALLQYWRKTRNLSQLALATEAEVSPRHVCFVETGRAKPSREMVLQLATVLDVPLRERNALLLAAGFAPVYGEARLDSPEIAPVRNALDAILKQQEPFPAAVLDRHWNIQQLNAGGTRFFSWLLGGRAPAGTPNVLRLMFDPAGLRPHVTNWEAVAETLVRRTHREAIGGVHDAVLAQLLAEVLAYPDVPARLRAPNLVAPQLPIVPVCFAKDDLRFDFFSTITTLGTPQDVTLQELRIECFFPASADTEERARRVLGTS
jgi:transcriptional regulator with XRE-family HTH domain